MRSATPVANHERHLGMLRCGEILSDGPERLLAMTCEDRVTSLLYLARTFDRPCGGQVALMDAAGLADLATRMRPEVLRGVLATEMRGAGLTGFAEAIGANRVIHR
jgi:hypothetical protein